MAEPVVVPRRREDFFKSNGDPTLRFTRFLESLTDTTNVSTTAIEENTENITINAGAISDNTDLININSGLIAEIPIYSGFMAQIQFLQRQFDGLPEFTMETEGFTMDSAEFTMDKVIA
ncbi:MAG: hypothetical protein HRU18_14175 [Pseudoalteromonas sp.]|uniref:hypothetical protein n=1 Tax=Pseudoalteromonas sp. TaxID=53249 RepID=UPI001D70F21F|nr:hypothetical protein [Pseudoalteromonas sp.]NRA79351.1 hypothetical protein [Pseudoalteromonas sp.]